MFKFQMVRKPSGVACAVLVTYASFILSPYGAGAMAQEKSPAAVVGFRTLESSPESFFRTELTAELAKNPNFRFLDENFVRPVIEDAWTEDRSTPKKLIREAFSHFDAGKKSYGQLMMDDAIDSFNKSVIGYREGIGALRDNRYLLISHLYLGMALMVVGRKAEGQNFMREMILLDPNRNNRKLSQTEFPPEVVLVHRNLTKQVLSAPLGTLTLSFQPADANVYIDAVIQEGKETITRELPVGEHFVVIEKKGYRQFSKRILIKPGVNAIQAELEEWQLLSPYAFERRNNLLASEDLVKLSADLSTKFLVLGNMIPASPGKTIISAQLFDATSKEFSKIERMEVPHEEIQATGKKIAKKLLQHISKSGRVIPDMRRTSDALVHKVPKTKVESGIVKESGHSTSIVQKWWFWTALGVVGAGAAGFLLLKKEDPTFNVINIDNPL